MLKGTNSEDKLSGSIKLIEQLIQLKAVGLVATHDLKLTELASSYPQNITNKCFEIELTEGELLFDYKLTDGVTSTMNANFLMRKMGIIS
jgi:DNA mismatch repair ATPase MutS